jgi:hypothetical protein
MDVDQYAEDLLDCSNTAQTRPHVERLIAEVRAEERAKIGAALQRVIDTLQDLWRAGQRDIPWFHKTKADTQFEAQVRVLTETKRELGL